MTSESLVTEVNQASVNMSILLGHTARQTNQVGFRRGVLLLGISILDSVRGLSRHKVSVGEPADGSPPFLII